MGGRSTGARLGCRDGSWTDQGASIQDSKQDSKPYPPRLGVTGKHVILVSPGSEQSVGTQESATTMAERICNIKTYRRKLGPIAMKIMESIVLHYAAPESGALVLHSVPLEEGLDWAPGTRPVQYQGLGEIANPTPGAEIGRHTASYPRIAVLESVGEGAARAEYMDTKTHMEYLAQYVKGGLGVSGTDGLPPVAVNVLLDTGLGVKSISEELLTKIQRASRSRQLAPPLQGSICLSADGIWRGTSGGTTDHPASVDVTGAMGVCAFPFSSRDFAGIGR